MFTCKKCGLEMSSKCPASRSVFITGPDRELAHTYTYATQFVSINREVHQSSKDEFEWVIRLDARGPLGEGYEKPPEEVMGKVFEELAPVMKYLMCGHEWTLKKGKCDFGHTHR